MTIIGYIGSILLALCGVPQAIKAWKTNSAKDISWLFLLSWLLGEMFTFAYVLPKFDLPLLLNYVVNMIVISVIIKIKNQTVSQKSQFSSKD
jgi:uncharacterized protein with PQ loop repeat